MLVLSRKVGQDILIGRDGDIVVRVLEAKRGSVRLGIVAPPECPVHRREVFQKLQENANGLSAALSD